MKPGPKPDPSKPNSRYNPASRHSLGGRSICSNGHEWVEGSYKVRGDGKKICLICIEERKGDTCKNGHDRATYQNMYGACRECNRENGLTNRLMSKYGLTLQDYSDLWNEQGGFCKICEEPLIDVSHARVDHDHNHCPECVGEKTCGKSIRGLLCDNCNKLLGHARDSVEVLEAATKYLLGN